VWTTGIAWPGVVERAAGRAEAAGFDGLAVVDSQNLAGDPWVGLALAARGSARIRLGTAGANPVTRHPALPAPPAVTLPSARGGGGPIRPRDRAGRLRPRASRAGAGLGQDVQALPEGPPGVPPRRRRRVRRPRLRRDRRPTGRDAGARERTGGEPAPLSPAGLAQGSGRGGGDGPAGARGSRPPRRPPPAPPGRGPPPRPLA